MILLPRELLLPENMQEKIKEMKIIEIDEEKNVSQSRRKKKDFTHHYQHHCRVIIDLTIKLTIFCFLCKKISLLLFCTVTVPDREPQTMHTVPIKNNISYLAFNVYKSLKIKK